VDVPGAPERALQMDPLDRGSLVHDVLDRFVAGVITGGPGDEARLRAVAEEVFAEYEARGVTGREIFWRRDRERLLRDLVEFVSHDAARGATALRTEYRFGPPAPVQFVLGDGRVVAFRGAVDRIDEGPDGGLVVTDYKTGSAKRYQGLSALDPTAGGRRFQLPVYALAARAAAGRPDAPVDAGYWFVTSKWRFQRVGYVVDEAVLERAGEVLGKVDALIGDGVFPAVPTAAVFVPYVECEFCDPDHLGPGERRRDWERKRSAEGLIAFRELLGDG